MKTHALAWYRQAVVFALVDETINAMRRKTYRQTEEQHGQSGLRLTESGTIAESSLVEYATILVTIAVMAVSAFALFGSELVSFVEAVQRALVM